MNRFDGLTDEEASARLRRNGPNELPRDTPRGVGVLLLETLREPMFSLLIGGGVLYLVLGDVGEAGMLMSFVVVVIGLNLYQGRKTERALEALRQLSCAQASVLRGGRMIRVAARDLVAGDVVRVAEGDRVPADGLLLSSTPVAVDESLLSGEALPVAKFAWDGLGPLSRPGGRGWSLFSGTLVVSGQATMRIEATGPRTELGRIGAALKDIETRDTPLQQETRRAVRVVVCVAGTLCLVAFLAYGLARGEWLRGLLSSITLAMALLPEEIPLVFTIFLALGSWRLARGHVLTRRPVAIEALGATTVLCSDKTGTLTTNCLTVRTLCRMLTTGPESLDVTRAGSVDEPWHALVEHALLASHRDAVDPMDRAVHAFARATLDGTEHLHPDWLLTREFPLSTERLAFSRAWRVPGDASPVVAAKGAPEAVADLCHLDAAANAAVMSAVAAMAARGQRVIAVGSATAAHPRLAGGVDRLDVHDFDFHLVGLIGFEDAVREDVPGAVAEARAAGIRVVMITGDGPETAREVAAQIGLRQPDRWLTGVEIDRLGDDDLSTQVADIDVFARVMPQHKLRLVRALQARAEVVAMTGDGVNDAPALRAADVGIAMGARGTDVAREAAALVLLDDRFPSIVAAVRGGRVIFDNLRKAVTYIFAIHVPVAGLSLMPVLLGWPLILMPVHIVFLELVIDPACSIVFEAAPAEAGVMGRPPRAASEALIDRRTVLQGLGQGLVVLVVTMLVFTQGYVSALDETELRARTFAVLILSNILLIATNLAWSGSAWRSRSLGVVSAAALAFMLLCLHVPVLNTAFHVCPLQAGDWGVVGAAALLTGLCLRPFRRRQEAGEKAVRRPICRDRREAAIRTR